MLKLGFLYAVTASWLAWHAIQNVGVSIAIVAAAVVGLGTIWAKGVVPLVHAGRRLAAATDAIFELVDWKQQMNQRFEHIEQRLNHIEQHLGPDVVVRHEIGHSKH